MKLFAIRDMLPGDVAVIAAIERLCFSTPWSETSFYTEVYSRRSLKRLAMANGIAAGYVIVRQILDDAHLLDLAVHPDYRKRGVAKALMDDVLLSVRERGCKAFHLEVRTSNIVAIGLYERLGFRVVGTRQQYYTQPDENGVLMSLDLASPSD